MIKDPMKRYCDMCHCELDDINDPGSFDCGGDCRRCMAYFGDPDCIRAMRELEPNNPEWLGTF